MLKVEQPERERERDPFFFFLTKVVERERETLEDSKTLLSG